MEDVNTFRFFVDQLGVVVPGRLIKVALVEIGLFYLVGNTAGQHGENTGEKCEIALHAIE